MLFLEFFQSVIYALALIFQQIPLKLGTSKVSFLNVPLELFKLTNTVNEALSLSFASSFSYLYHINHCFFSQSTFFFVLGMERKAFSNLVLLYTFSVARIALASLTVVTSFSISIRTLQFMPINSGISLISVSTPSQPRKALHSWHTSCGMIDETYLISDVLVVKSIKRTLSIASTRGFISRVTSRVPH